MKDLRQVCAEEQGVNGFESGTWQGMLAPKAMPDALVGAEKADEYQRTQTVPVMLDPAGQPIKRNFVHVSDLVSAILCAIDHPKARQQTFNICMDEPVDYGEVARYLGKYGSERVKKAAFIAAIPPFLLKTPDNRLGVDSGVFEGIKQALAADRLAFLSAFLANFYNVDVLGGKLISDQVVQANWNIASGASPKGTLDCVSAWLTDFRKDLAAIIVPTLVVHGDADRIVPLAASAKRTHEAIKGSRLVVLEGAPHGLNWTHAEQLNRALMDFLGKGN